MFTIEKKKKGKLDIPLLSLDLIKQQQQQKPSFDGIDQDIDF